MEDVVTKFTRVLSRPDGSEVKLVAQRYVGAGLHLSVGVDVFKRTNPHGSWQLCSDRPHPRWRDMPLDTYCKTGRSEKLQAASHGEILAVARMIGQPLSCLPAGTAVH